MKTAAASDETGRATSTLARLSVAIVASVLMPIVLFPAFSSDYGLRGMNEFLLGILAAASLGFAFRLLAVGPYTSTMRRRLGALLLAGIAAETTRKKPEFSGISGKNVFVPAMIAENVVPKAELWKQLMYL